LTRKGTLKYLSDLQLEKHSAGNEVKEVGRSISERELQFAKQPLGSFVIWQCKVQLTRLEQLVNPLIGLKMVKKLRDGFSKIEMTCSGTTI
jgi:hypothetical protein